MENDHSQGLQGRMQKIDSSFMLRSMWRSLPGRCVDCLLILFVSALAANKLAPAYLNSDVILNSIMSLQKVTLFYWGQNRLLNVAPFLFSSITDPGVNLAAHIFFFSCVFFALLYSIAYLIRFSAGIRPCPKTREVFLLGVVCVVVVLRPFTLFALLIGHIEYSLALLMCILAFLMLSRRERPLFQRCVVCAPLLFLALGVNGSMLVPSLFFAWTLLLTGKWTFTEAFVVSFLALLSFLLWHVLSMHFPSPPFSYYDFFFSGLTRNIGEAVNTIAESFFHTKMLYIFSFFGALLFLEKKHIEESLWKTTASLLLFCVVWIVIFANNAWVVVNRHHFRYFAPVVFVLLGLAIMLIFLNVASIRKSVRFPLILLLFAWCVYDFAAPLVPWKEYEIFKRTEELKIETVSDETVFFAGEYWSVWPAVMRELMSDRASFGFSGRGEGNKEGAAFYALEELHRRNVVTVHCVDASEEECLEQVGRFLEGPFVVSSRQFSPRYRRISISAGPSVESSATECAP